MFGISFDKGTGWKIKISEYLNALMHRFGYYRIDDLQSGGHCGLCGKAINGVFEKDWPVGICDDCANTK